MFKKMFANCLLVSDFDKSFDFYKNVLGLEVNSHEGHFANFKLDNVELAIMQFDQAAEMLPQKYMTLGGGSLFCFQVDDVNKTADDLKSKGVVFISGPKVTSWGQTVAYFQDPDNHIWEISKP